MSFSFISPPFNEFKNYLNVEAVFYNAAERIESARFAYEHKHEHLSASLLRHNSTAVDDVHKMNVK